MIADNDHSPGFVLVERQADTRDGEDATEVEEVRIALKAEVVSLLAARRRRYKITSHIGKTESDRVITRHFEPNDESPVHVTHLGHAETPANDNEADEQWCRTYYTLIPPHYIEERMMGMRYAV